MTVPTFAALRKDWAYPPVDDVGYVSSQAMLEYSDDALRYMVEKFERARYGGWRNYQGRWRRILGLDSTRGKDVLDYGCGVGIEGLQYAKRGNRVSLADIAPANWSLACRVFEVADQTVAHAQTIKANPPFLSYADGSFDVIHCAGVLHHIPQPKPVVKQMSKWLRPKGELRLMVYSDKAWTIATGSTELPEHVEEDPLFARYWQCWDPHGGYADWYNAPRLHERFGTWFEVARCEPLTERGEYYGAVLVKK